MSEKYIIPVFVPHLGCPNNCTFCNQKSISGQIKNVDLEEVKKTKSGGGAFRREHNLRWALRLPRGACLEEERAVAGVGEPGEGR